MCGSGGTGAPGVKENRSMLSTLIPARPIAAPVWRLK
jgi:hypothetical protein